jgi:hypothetical protein
MAERKVRIAEKRIKMTEKGNDRKAKEILHSANAPFRMTSFSVTLRALARRVSCRDSSLTLRMTKKRRGRVLSLKLLILKGL